MPRSNRVTRSDLLALLRLAGELNELPVDREPRVRHMLARLCTLFHAPVATMQEVRGFRPGATSFPTLWAYAAGDESTFELFRRFAFEARNSTPTLAALAAQPGRAFRREDIMADRDWFRSVAFNEFVRPAGVDLGLGTSHAAGRGDGVIGVAVNRRLRERRFTTRDRALLQIVTDEFGWFFRSIATRAAPAGAALPTHLRRVLDRLLAGDSEKIAAVRLGLSRHTVHDYVKALYRRFAVSSRAELLVALLHEANAGPALLNGEGAPDGARTSSAITAAGVHAG